MYIFSSAKKSSDHFLHVFVRRYRSIIEEMPIDWVRFTSMARYDIHGEGPLRIRWLFEGDEDWCGGRNFRLKGRSVIPALSALSFIECRSLGDDDFTAGLPHIQQYGTHPTTVWCRSACLGNFPPLRFRFWPVANKWQGSPAVKSRQETSCVSQSARSAQRSSLRRKSPTQLSNSNRPLVQFVGLNENLRSLSHQANDFWAPIGTLADSLDLLTQRLYLSVRRGCTASWSRFGTLFDSVLHSHQAIRIAGLSLHV